MAFKNADQENGNIETLNKIFFVYLMEFSGVHNS